MTPAESTMQAWLPMTEKEIVDEWTTLRRIHPTQFRGDPVQLLKSLERRKLARCENGVWYPWSVEEYERTQATQKTLF